MSRALWVFMMLLLVLTGVGNDTLNPDTNKRVNPTAATGAVSSALPDTVNNSVDHPSNHEQHIEARKEDDEMDPKSRDWTIIGSLVTAVFTAILAIVSIFQSCAIRKANSVAKEATNATKRSVEAQVESIRGNLDLVHCALDGGFLSPTFVNNGSSPLVVRKVSRHLQPWRDVKSAPDPISEFDNSDVFGRYVPPGGEFRPYGEHGVEVFKGRGDAIQCFAQFHVEYDTAGVRISYRCAWRFHEVVGMSDFSHSMKVAESRYDFQNEIPRPT